MFILRRPKLAGILLAAIFPSPCILAVRLIGPRAWTLSRVLYLL